MLLGLLEMGAYPSLAAVRAEDAEIVRLSEIRRLGTPARMPEGGDDWLG